MDVTETPEAVCLWWGCGCRGTQGRNHTLLLNSKKTVSLSGCDMYPPPLQACVLKVWPPAGGTIEVTG